MLLSTNRSQLIRRFYRYHCALPSLVFVLLRFMQSRNKIFRLEGVVQHYAWGGTHLFRRYYTSNQGKIKPFAEYWMGAHDNAPAEIVIDDGNKKKLNQLILENPDTAIGEKVFAILGGFLILLKILDVKDMLSIQVHPDKKSAEVAFEEENKKGNRAK